MPPPLPPGLAAAGAAGQPGPHPLTLPAPAAEPLATAPLPDADAGEHAAFQLKRPSRRSPASTGAAPAIASLLAVVAAGVAAYVLWPYLADAVRRPRQVAAGTAAVPPPAGSASRPAVPSPAPAQDPAFTGREPPAEPVRPRRPPRPRPVARTEPGTPPEPARPEPIPFEPTPPRPPIQVPAPPQPSREQRARAAAAVEKALGEAYSALRRGEFDAADRQVAAAARLAADDEQLDDRVLCWQQFALYARQFPQHRDAAINASVGEDYDLRRGDGSVTRIAIVEANANEFKYRSAGITKRVARSDIPQPIVTAIMRKWFAAHDQAGNHVLMGVYHLTKAEPDPTAARRAWQQALQMGADVSNLEPLLDDPIIRAAAAEPAPGRGQ
jgi:hypothetical protein